MHSAIIEMNCSCFEAFAAGSTLTLAVFSLFSLVLDMKFQSKLEKTLTEGSGISKKAGTFSSKCDRKRPPQGS